MNEKDKKRIGKFISLVLRHEPEFIELEMDEQGWVNVDELIAKCALKRISFTKLQLEEIVETNDKKRYSFNSDRTRIRANQGHSVDIELGLIALQPPEYLYHGTADRFIASILEKGIQKMSRQHVHLSKDKETAVKVGSRHGRPYVLTVMSGKMYQNGIRFYQSENGVWLTDCVSPEYLLI